MFVDSHLHLDFDDFSTDRAAVMQRARSAGVERFLSIGIKVRDFGRVLAVAEAYEDVYCTVGALPHFADDEHDVTADEIVAHTDHPKVWGYWGGRPRHFLWQRLLGCPDRGVSGSYRRCSPDAAAANHPFRAAGRSHGRDAA